MGFSAGVGAAALGLGAAGVAGAAAQRHHDRQQRDSTYNTNTTTSPNPGTAEQSVRTTWHSDPDSTSSGNRLSGAHSTNGAASHENPFRTPGASMDAGYPTADSPYASGAFGGGAGTSRTSRSSFSYHPPPGRPVSSSTDPNILLSVGQGGDGPTPYGNRSGPSSPSTSQYDQASSSSPTTTAFTRGRPATPMFAGFSSANSQAGGSSEGLESDNSNSNSGANVGRKSAESAVSTTAPATQPTAQSTSPPTSHPVQQPEIREGPYTGGAYPSSGEYYNPGPSYYPTQPTNTSLPLTQHPQTEHASLAPASAELAIPHTDRPQFQRVESGIYPGSEADQFDFGFAGQQPGAGGDVYSSTVPPQLRRPGSSGSYGYVVAKTGETPPSTAGSLPPHGAGLSGMQPPGAGVSQQQQQQQQQQRPPPVAVATQRAPEEEQQEQIQQSPSPTTGNRRFSIPRKPLRSPPPGSP